jgi:GGDEF domain-containing protein
VAEAFGPAVDDVGLLDRLAGLGACRKLVAERLQACPACGSQQLGFRQACPRCGALDFTRVAVIRHPACGHQAERGAFTNGPRLVCPGCGQELRPDGHDHELQAAACLCHACAAIAAEPAVQAVCRHCGQLTPPEDTVEHVVYAYELTPLADEAVAGNRLSGVDLAVVLRDRPHGFYAKPYFLHEVTRELARFRRYRSPFSLLVVRLNHLAPIRANQPARVAAYLDHLFTSIGRDLRNLDLICVWGADLLAVLLPETGLDGAQALAKRMIARAEQADPHHDRKGPILSAAAITCNAEDEDPERLLAEAQASLVGASEP